MDHRTAAQLMAAECLCFRARRVSRAMTRVYDEELRSLGIQATQLTLLNAVALAGERGAQMSRLTDVLAMDATTLSRNLRPLEREGLVRIERSDADRRLRIARLTEQGREQLERALPLWKRAQQRMVEAMGREAVLDLRNSFDAAVTAVVGSELLPLPPGAAPGD